MIKERDGNVLKIEESLPCCSDNGRSALREREENRWMKASKSGSIVSKEPLWRVERQMIQMTYQRRFEDV